MSKHHLKQWFLLNKSMESNPSFIEILKLCRRAILSSLKSYNYAGNIICALPIKCLISKVLCRCSGILDLPDAICCFLVRHYLAPDWATDSSPLEIQNNLKDKKKSSMEIKESCVLCLRFDFLYFYAMYTNKLPIVPKT